LESEPLEPEMPGTRRPGEALPQKMGERHAHRGIGGEVGAVVQTLPGGSAAGACRELNRLRWPSDRSLKSGAGVETQRMNLRERVRDNPPPDIPVHVYGGLTQPPYPPCRSSPPCWPPPPPC
jgi:hypothetical protein